MWGDHDMWRESADYSHYQGDDEPGAPEDDEPNPREKHEDDGLEYGHPGDYLRGRE
jgi:hypothetical protein